MKGRINWTGGFSELEKLILCNFKNSTYFGVAKNLNKKNEQNFKS